MSLDMNWLAAGAAAVLIACCVNGYRRGFVKEIVSAFFVVLALAAVWAINPYVNQFLTDHTPVSQKIEETCLDFLEEQIAAEDSAGTGEEPLTEEMQGDLIENLPLPSFLKGGMLENNQSGVYELLGVHSFLEYVAGYLARMLTNGISFLLSYFLATLLIRMIVFGLDIMAKLPVLRGLNRFAGIFVGGFRGLLFLWVAFLIITICWNTSWGRECVRMIDDSRFLSFLYEKDIFVDLYMSIFYGGAG